MLSKRNPNSSQLNSEQLGLRLDIGAAWNPPPHPTPPQGPGKICQEISYPVLRPQNFLLKKFGNQKYPGGL